MTDKVSHWNDPSSPMETFGDFLLVDEQDSFDILFAKEVGLQKQVVKDPSKHIFFNELE